MEPLFKFLYVFAGTIAAAFFSKDSPSAVDRIERMLPGRSQHTYERIDFLLVVIFSSLAAYHFYAPQDQAKALLAGFSAVALLKQILIEVNRGTYRKTAK